MCLLWPKYTNYILFVLHFHNTTYIITVRKTICRWIFFCFIFVVHIRMEINIHKMMCYFFCTKAKVKVWIKKIILRKAPQSHSETFLFLLLDFSEFCTVVVVVVECDGVSVTLRHPITNITPCLEMAHGE